MKPGGLHDRGHPEPHPEGLALAKIGAEYVLRWLPRGTHDWNRFIPPDRT